MASSDLSNIYQLVIDDVIANIQQDFENDGVDESVLQDLRHSWKSKLHHTNAVGPRAPPPAVEGSMPSGPSEPVYDYPHDQQYSYANNYASDSNYSDRKYGNQGNQGNAGYYKNVPQVDGSFDSETFPRTMKCTFTVDLKDDDADCRPNNENTKDANDSTILNTDNVTATTTNTANTTTTNNNDQISKMSNYSNRNKHHVSETSKNESLTKPSKCKKGDIPQLDGEGSSPSPFADEEEDEPLGSDLDSDGEEDEDTIDSILCQYDKVARLRNKWKAHLKDGIMHINGRDYGFQKATGEFEW